MDQFRIPEPWTSVSRRPGSFPATCIEVAALPLVFASVNSDSAFQCNVGLAESSVGRIVGPAASTRGPRNERTGN